MNKKKLAIKLCIILFNRKRILNEIKNEKGIKLNDDKDNESVYNKN